MIRVLKVTVPKLFEDRALPESVHLSVSTTLTQDAEIVGDLYLSGFIPAKVISKKELHCNCSDIEELLVQYDDQYLTSYSEANGVATSPLKASDVTGVVRDSTEIRFLKAYADSLVA